MELNNRLVIFELLLVFSELSDQIKDLRFSKDVVSRCYDIIQSKELDKKLNDEDYQYLFDQEVIIFSERNKLMERLDTGLYELNKKASKMLNQFIVYLSNNIESPDIKEQIDVYKGSIDLNAFFISTIKDLDDILLKIKITLTE